MAAGASDEATLARYARAQARLEARGGYLWRDRATAMAHGLGFRDADLDRTLDTFSGGQLTRASLARALATGADVLLLDEPTNHLDIESLEWLEQTLVDLDAAVVLVAHDRWFLEAVGTAVLELQEARPPARASSPARWHQWRREQAAREIALGKAIETQQAEIERMERFIERFRYKATKAKQAQSRVKKLAKIERIERDPADGEGPRVRVRRARALGARDLRAARRPHRGRESPPVGAARARRAVARARRARLAGGPQRHRQDDADRDARRPPPAGGGQAEHGPQREGRLPLPARRRARRGRSGRAERARRGPARDRPDAEQGARAARALPVLRRGGRETAQRALRRRAPAPVAGGARAAPAPTC